MARPKAPCGTDSAYKRHLAVGEPTCGPCRAAHATAQRARRARKADERRLGVELEPLDGLDTADPVFSDAVPAQVGSTEAVEASDSPTVDWFSVAADPGSGDDAVDDDEEAGDYLADLYLVRDALKAAIRVAQRSEPLKMAPLVRELRATWREIQGVVGGDDDEAERDPFDDFIDDGADASDNVVGFPGAQDREQA